MNCQSFESMVNDLARDQVMETTVREQAAVHSASCEMCLVRLREEQNLTRALHEFSALVQAEATPDGVEPKLLAEFRVYQAAKVASGSSLAHQTVIATGSGNRRRYWAYAAVAAAVIVAGLGLSVIRLSQVGFQANPVETAPVTLKEDSSHSANPPVKELKADVRPASERVQARNPRRFAKQTASSRSSVTKNTVTVKSLNILATNYEVTTDFIPIGYSNASNVQEGGQVMRLELPRYAMARFGVPVNVDRYDERVKADVWVGADGLARAIRFVQ